MRTFLISERSDTYFIAKVEGMHCRILIDDNSRDLPLGQELKLHVEEISNKYAHYASDAIFKLTLPLEQQDSIAICTLHTGRKNRFIYQICVRLGGKWEPILNEWIFSQSVEEKVHALNEIIRSQPIIVEAEFKETITELGKELSLFGYPLVKGLRLNNSPILHKDIRIRAGDIAFIPGVSSKTIARAGTKVRLKIPQAMLDNADFKEDYFAALTIRKVRVL